MEPGIGNISPALVPASKAALKGTSGSYFRSPQSLRMTPMPPPIKGFQREPVLKSYQTFTMPPNWSAGPDTVGSVNGSSVCNLARGDSGVGQLADIGPAEEHLALDTEA